MGFKKLFKFLTLYFILFAFCGCFLSIKKSVPTEAKDFPPLPKINMEKQLVILPFENHTKKMEYDILAQSIPDIFYSFLRFVKTYPFSPDMALLNNEQEFFNYFGIQKPTPVQRKKLILSAIKMNSYRDFSKEKKKFQQKFEVYDFETKILNKSKTEDEKKMILSIYNKNPESTHYLLKTTELTDDEYKKYTEYLNRIDYKDPDEGSAEKFLKLPEYFDLKVYPPSKNVKTIKDALFLKGEITREGIIQVYIYDSILDRKLFSMEIPLGNISLTDIEENNIKLDLFILPLLKFLKKFTSKDFYQLNIERTPEDATVYIDGEFIDLPVVLIPSGTHSIKALKNNFEPFYGVFKIEENQKLEIKLKEKLNFIEVKIETKPTFSPVFVNSEYKGLSPITVNLSEGIHQIRVSREGYEHENHMLHLYSFDKKKDIQLVLQKENLLLEEQRKNIRFFKNIAFYSFFPFLAAHIYMNEKESFYDEKVRYYRSNWTTLTDTQKQAYYDANDKSKLYGNANAFFRNGSIFLLVTAAFFHILDLQMDDVGFGIDQDKRLGIYIKW